MKYISPGGSGWGLGSRSAPQEPPSTSAAARQRFSWWDHGAFALPMTHTAPRHRQYAFFGRCTGGSQCASSDPVLLLCSSSIILSDHDGDWGSNASPSRARDWGGEGWRKGWGREKWWRKGRDTGITDRGDCNGLAPGVRTSTCPQGRGHYDIVDKVRMQGQDVE